MKFEGLRLEPYKDPNGYITIGYGHLLTRDPEAKLSDYPSISVGKASMLLHDDLRRAEHSVRNLVTVKLKNGQWAALIDLVFNIGVEAFQRSTLLDGINHHADEADLEYQFRRWVYGDGRKLPGLVKRREAELRLWEGPSRTR